MQPTRRTSLSLSPEAEAFLRERHLGTITTFRPDGSPHVVAVRFTWDPSSGLARVMTVATSRKARNLVANPGSRAAVCQVAGSRWLTMEGTAVVSDDPQRDASGARCYTERYWSPPPALPDRVVIEIAVDRVMGLF